MQEDAGCKKKQEEFWLKLINRRNLIVDNCLIIGDDEKQDIQIPGKLGFHTYHVTKPEDLKNLYLLL